MLNYYATSTNFQNINIKQMSQRDLLDILCLKMNTATTLHMLGLDPVPNDDTAYESIKPFLKLIRNELFSRTPTSDMDYKKDIISAWLIYYGQKNQHPYLQTDEDKKQWVEFLMGPLDKPLEFNDHTDPEAHIEAKNDINSLIFYKLETCMLINHILPGAVPATVIEAFKKTIFEQAEKGAFESESIRIIASELSKNDLDRLRVLLVKTLDWLRVTKLEHPDMVKHLLLSFGHVAAYSSQDECDTLIIKLKNYFNSKRIDSTEMETATALWSVAQYASDGKVKELQDEMIAGPSQSNWDAQKNAEYLLYAMPDHLVKTTFDHLIPFFIATMRDYKEEDNSSKMTHAYNMLCRIGLNGKTTTCDKIIDELLALIISTTSHEQRSRYINMIDLIAPNASNKKCDEALTVCTDIWKRNAVYLVPEKFENLPAKASEAKCEEAIAPLMALLANPDRQTFYCYMNPLVQIASRASAAKCDAVITELLPKLGNTNEFAKKYVHIALQAFAKRASKAKCDELIPHLMTKLDFTRNADFYLGSSILVNTAQQASAQACDEGATQFLKSLHFPDAGFHVNQEYRCASANTLAMITGNTSKEKCREIISAFQRRLDWKDNSPAVVAPVLQPVLDTASAEEQFLAMMSTIRDRPRAAFIVTDISPKAVELILPHASEEERGKLLNTCLANLKHSDNWVREQAIRSIGMIAPYLPKERCDDLLVSVMHFLTDKDSHISKAAYEVLGKFLEYASIQHSGDIIKTIFFSLNSYDPYIRAKANDVAMSLLAKPLSNTHLEMILKNTTTPHSGLLNEKCALIAHTRLKVNHFIAEQAAKMSVVHQGAGSSSRGEQTRQAMKSSF